MSIEKVVASLGLKTTSYWVNLLQTLPPHERGVIKLTARLCQTSSLFHTFVEEVAYLVNETSIVLPIVVETRRKERDFYQKKLTSALEGKGLSVYRCSPDLVKLQPSLRENTWSVDTIFSAPVMEAIYQKRIPLFMAAGVVGEEVYSVPGILLARELVYTLHAKKLILVGHAPICDKKGICITDILSEQEWQKKIYRREIMPAMARRVTMAFEILSRLGPGHSVQITQPRTKRGTVSTGLLEELLGNGSGTYIALPPQITVYPMEAIDESWLKQMICEAFLPQGKVLREDYFDMIRPFHPLVYLDGLRKGGALVYKIEGAPYMCKLFTRQDYEGIGIGTTVIQTILKHFHKLCWRTSRQQEKNHLFYQKIVQEYDGVIETTDQFFLYFIGFDPTTRRRLLSLLDRFPSSFVQQEKESKLSDEKNGE